MVALVGTDAKPGVLVNRDFALLWAGQSLSVLGDFVFETTLVVWIAADLGRGRAWSALAVSGLLAAAAVPVLLAGPIAGVLVDRWRDPRRVMLRANALSALLVLALIPAAGIVSPPFLRAEHLPLAWRLGAVLAVVFLLSAVGQFFRPAASVLVRDIVPEPHRARAMSLNQASTSLALLIGPPLAAPLLFAFGPAWALLVNAASFLASLLAVRAIPAPHRAGEVAVAVPTAGLLTEFADGVRFFRRSRVLVALATSLAIVMFGAGALNALDVFFVTRNLGAPAEDYGVLSAAQGAGMLLGAVLSGLLAARLGLERMVWGPLAALGLLILVYARLTSFVAAVAVLFLLGLVVPAINVSVGPILLRVTPRAFVGRVSATLNPLMNAASILGLLLGGFLYGTVLHDLHLHAFGVRVGPLDTIFTGVGILWLGGAAYAFANLPRAPTDPAARGPSEPAAHADGGATAGHGDEPADQRLP